MRHRSINALIAQRGHGSPATKVCLADAKHKILDLFCPSDDVLRAAGQYEALIPAYLRLCPRSETGMDRNAAQLIATGARRSWTHSSRSSSTYDRPHRQRQSIVREPLAVERSASSFCSAAHQGRKRAELRRHSLGSVRIRSVQCGRMHSQSSLMRRIRALHASAYRIGRPGAAAAVSR